MTSNDLSASALFNVNGLVALVTGGGTGESPGSIGRQETELTSEKESAS